MKKNLFILFITLFTLQVQSQDFKIKKDSLLTIEDFKSQLEFEMETVPVSTAEIQEAEPLPNALKNVFDRLYIPKIGIEAPKGNVWRTGANEAAELTLYTDMMLGTTKIKAGTYTFYLIPGEEKWTAIVSTDINVWGSYFYNEKNDVARIDVPVSKGEESLEAFSIAFEKSDNGIHMHLGWGTVRVAVPFTK